MEATTKTLDCLCDDFLFRVQNEKTRNTYASALGELMRRGILDGEMALSDFCKVPFSSIEHKIARESQVAGTTNVRLACFYGLIKTLRSVDNGAYASEIPKGNTVKVDGKGPYKKGRECTKYDSISHDAVGKVVKHLYATDKFLAATTVLIFGGARRIHEVLNVKWKDVNVSECAITFRVGKSNDERYRTIHYDEATFARAIGVFSSVPHDDDDFVVRRQNGRRLAERYGREKLKNAAAECGVGNNITFHNLRASAITHMYTEKGFRLEEIREISGHSTHKQVVYYIKKAEKNKTHQRPIAAFE